MGDYLEEERMRYEDDKGDEGVQRVTITSFNDGDPISEEYYKIIDAGCSLVKEMNQRNSPVFRERSFDILNKMSLLWLKWDDRLKEYTSSLEELEALAREAEEDCGQP